MIYPLNMQHTAAGGFAVANDEAEHQALSAAGYEPKWQAQPDGDAQAQEAEEIVHTVESLRALLDAAGIPYDNRWGVGKLKAALPA